MKKSVGPLHRDGSCCQSVTALLYCSLIPCSPVTVWVLAMGYSLSRIYVSTGYNPSETDCSSMGPSGAPAPARYLLLCRLLYMGCSFIQGRSTCVGSSTGCSVDIFSTAVFSMVCRGISTLATGVPPRYPSQLSLVSAELFPSRISYSSHS